MSTQTQAPFTRRPAATRGHAQHGGWLDTWHSFSFADYHDPKAMGHSVLRVLNDDKIAAGRGFGAHPHQDMEIITVVLSGAVAHQDSTGGKAVLKANEVQRMTAGRGITHSEANPSPDEPLHLLQIWLFPQERGLTPGYEQKVFPREARLGRFQVVVAPGAPDGALHIHQDARLLRAAVDAQNPMAEAELAEGRKGWLQVATGRVLLNGQPLEEGDGARFDQGGAVVVEALDGAEAEVLLFDLP